MYTSYASVSLVVPCNWLYWDVKFFDKEVVVDCMGELNKADVDHRVYRLYFYLNQRTGIRVKTGCGYSD